VRLSQQDKKRTGEVRHIRAGSRGFRAAKSAGMIMSKTWDIMRRVQGRLCQKLGKLHDKCGDDYQKLVDSSVRALDMKMAHGNICGKRRDRIVKSLCIYACGCRGSLPKTRGMWNLEFGIWI
jgi:hypothetical protein